MKIKKLKNDALGSRMKDYEMRSKSYLPRKTCVIIRIDGKSFHTYTRGLNKPFDEGLMEDMAETTKYICSNIQGAKLGYTQSDEISILVTDFDNKNSDAWFDGQVQKICSVAASYATSKFNQMRTIRYFNNADDIYSIDEITYNISNMKLGEFDARCYSLPDEEVVNYFIWRQQDASKNSVSMLAQANFSHKSLQNKNGSQMQDMLMLEKNINWDDLKVPKKRGYCIIKRKELRETTNSDEKVYRNSWIVDDNIPIFTADRKYISSLIPSRNEKTLDEKIIKLFTLTNNFLYVDYYSHTNDYMYKIENEYTNFNKDILVLNSVSDGFEKSLDLAIENIAKCKEEFNKSNS